MNAPRVVDVHAHHVGADLIERIGTEGEGHGVRLVATGPVTRVEVAGRLSGLPLLPQLSDVEARREWMDAAGVDTQLVAPWMDLAGYELSAADGLWLSRAQNESTSALVAAHPDRFAGVATVPLQDPDAAADELRRAVEEGGHVAVQIGARVSETGLDDPVLEPFWAAAAELGVPVIVHPAELEVPERIRRLFLHILVGNPAETTFAAAALLLGGVLERHQALRVLLVHGGGFVPYQIGRIERGHTAAPPAFRGAADGSPRQFLGQLFFDTVLHDDDALRHLVGFAGTNNVVMGSDYPFPMRVDAPVAVLDPLGLAGDERDRILGANGLWRR